MLNHLYMKKIYPNLVKISHNSIFNLYIYCFFLALKKCLILFKIIVKFKSVFNRLSEIKIIEHAVKCYLYILYSCHAAA